MKQLLIASLLLLAACENFTPAPKTASYDPVTRELTLPHPCPDWSQSQTYNYLNENHSNFGCAVNTNMALQLDDPQDMNEGHGSHTDSESTARTITRYRSGELPQPIVPTPTTGVASQ